MNRAVVEKVANALLRARFERSTGRQAPENPLDLIALSTRSEAIEEAEIALAASGFDALQATVDAMHHDPVTCRICNVKVAASPKPVAAPEREPVPGNSAEGPSRRNDSDPSGGLR